MYVVYNNCLHLSQSFCVFTIKIFFLLQEIPPPERLNKSLRTLEQLLNIYINFTVRNGLT